MEEIWKDIEGYEGLYMISSMGRVKSVDRQVRKENYFRTVRENFLKQRLGKHGYVQVTLCKDGRMKTYLIHRLVAKAFIPNPESKPYIDHINTIKTDNRTDNLRWVTRKENGQNPLSRLHRSECQKGEKNCMYGKFGKEHNRSIPIVQLTMDGKYIRGWDCTRQVERELGFRSNNICSVLRKRTNSAHGYKWMYKSDYYAQNTETA